jgi:hypothetical protein
MTQTLETLQQHFRKFSKIAAATGDRSEPVAAMLDALGERIIMCPATLQEQEGWSKPGGLIRMSIEVTGTMRNLAAALDLEHIPVESIVITGLFHAIGMVGSVETPYLLDQDSDWHRKQGRLYRYNEVLPKVPIAHRSLQLLQHWGVKLTPEEWVAIAVAGGPQREENRFYVGSEPALAVLLTQARQWVYRNSSSSV